MAGLARIRCRLLVMCMHLVKRELEASGRLSEWRVWNEIARTTESGIFGCVKQTKKRSSMAKESLFLGNLGGDRFIC